MFLFQMALDVAILPVLVCAASFWLVLKLARGSKTGAGIAATVSLGAGYLTGHLRAVGFPPFPAVETTQWLFYTVALTTILAAWSVTRESRRVLAASLVIAMLLFTALRPMLTYHWSGMESMGWVIGLFAGLWLLWRALDRLVDSTTHAPHLLLSLLLVLAAVAVVLGMSATALLAQLAGSTAVCLAVLVIFAWFRGFPLSALTLLGLVIMSGLLINGYFYARLSGWNAILLGAAPAAAWFGHLPWLGARPVWQRGILTLLAVALATSPAIVSAVRAFHEEPAYDYYDYG